MALIVDPSASGGTTFTDGSVPFAFRGALVEDNAYFKWNDTAKYLEADSKYTPLGSGAAVRTVRGALDDLRAWISTDTVSSRFYRADATFSGTVDPGTFIGYNLTGFGQIEDATKAAIAIGMEANFNTGTFLSSEFHVDIAGPGQSFARPFAAYYAHTGANANKIYSVNILSGVDMLISAPGVMTLTAATFTVGQANAVFTLTGKMVVSTRILTTTTTDDTVSVLQAGAGDSAAGSITNILLRPGGFANPSDANAQSNGDKLTLWNGVGAKYAIGIDANGKFFIQEHRPSGSASATGFRFVGGTGTNSADLATLDSIGSLLSCAGTAIPAGGTAGAGLKVSSTSNFGVFFGSGAPTLSAAKGSLYLRSDGSGTTDRAYINTNGSTTWTAITTVA